MIYFDNSATTRPYPEALETYMQVASKILGNPSSLHRLGDQATRILDASRQQIADLIGKKSDEIFFTSGGTEGDNWIIKGVAFEKAQFGKHIIVSAIEHPAVKESALWLKAQGFEVDFAPVDNKGFVDVEALEDLIRPDTTLVSIMAVNNEIGSIQPIEAISEFLADKPTISFHVDAVQALAKIPTEKYLTERVDFATFSGHKFHGIRGVGFIYIKSGKKITPLLTGGGQERDYRSTTENVAGIAATAKALRLSMEKLDIFRSKTGQMKAVIRQALLNYPDIFVFSDEEDFAPHILTFGIKGVRGEVIVHAFEDYDIFISTTSACSSKAGKPAGTLIAMGVDKDKAKSAVRLSLDLENDMSQVEQFLTKLKLIYNQTRKVR
ncbi:TPA: cysteine desulfurase family protein [Streptococcus pneumoniae]|uniref:cysteine desulfurase family protein n=1 Tax=Streptococcus pneumoniae TaxID=1313 RepID=UPI0018CDB097|nr:cysteine desulfurase family protein [Streptococcus pneumoniae]QPN72769.1 aminotransferase class V-fold PLP-dependent enzyme [Streptococcus pneumoniae]QPN80593.1 aminotransferase class V-fold PLP-dependent enzyme [Streptococcus pneumoniae]QPN83172.1 aminotransferase class V-fold PLP-dependent enzyme [Streptococcus pneumoniae]QPN85225.1 aminotransferase class V-fold PLP-dependent enzyme [Streptococcus pneumoniae]HEV4592735.1 cysteine desulfurase [Streptococcus pneumoniae]